MAVTRLRVLTLDDAAELAAIARENVAHLTPWDPSRDPSWFTEDGQRAALEPQLAAFDAGAGVPFAIVDEHDEIVGRITLSGIIRGAFHSANLGYFVRSDRLRRGHASDAVGLAVEHAFSDLALHRVAAGTLPENTGSQAVLRRNGFERYGLAPEYLRINGAWHDHILFQRLNPAMP